VEEELDEERAELEATAGVLGIVVTVNLHSINIKEQNIE
jgi:hypothetical protein